MNYTVIGAAKSGLAAALLVKEKGFNVFLTESKDSEAYPEAFKILKENNINCEFGGNTERALDGADCIITSPGVNPSSHIIQEAEKRKIKIISELEFAYNYIDNPIIAITGTNGKTTTTTLTAYILNNGGKKAVTAGNIGTPLSALVGKLDKDTIIVVEVSSFQLDRIEKFKPKVSVILNITPDHLYYHGTMEKYVEAKFKIFCNQNEKDLVILNADDNEILKGASQVRGKIAWLSVNTPQHGIWTKEGKMLVKMDEDSNEEEIMLLDGIRLPGVHNVYNSMAAALAARAFEVRNEDIRDSLMAFQGVEHRLEFVRTIDGVDYINDSKATNVNATWFALSSYSSPLIWIAGGRGDSNDYSQLDSFVEKNVSSIIVIGEESDNIFNHFSSKLRVIKCSSLDDAVREAHLLAKPGEIVLFTPACKSFDMFMNFEHRGEVFKEIVHSI